MKPEIFPESNKALTKPSGWTDEQCATLHCWTDGKQYISKWRMSWRERLKVIFTGTVWFSCFSFCHPPVVLLADKPFQTPINHVANQRSPKWWRHWKIRRAINKALKESVKDKAFKDSMKGLWL